MPRTSTHVQNVPCPNCHGDGSVERGSIRDDLTYAIATCSRCHGGGRIDAEVKVTVGIEPKEYRLIREWGSYMGSFDYYISSEQEIAYKEGAPIDALFKSYDRGWVCASHLSRTHAFIVACKEKGLL